MASPEDRFTDLFNSLQRDLLAYAVRRVSTPQDAADAVADTFLVAWRRLDSVPDGDASRPWLFGVARRVIANQHRGARRRAGLAERLRAELESVVVPAPVVPEPSRLAGGMARLGEDDRELLRLVAWEDLQPSEIAVVLGIPAGTVRVRLHRARARLRRAMDEPLPTPAKRVGRSGHVPGDAAPVGAEEG